MCHKEEIPMDQNKENLNISPMNPILFSQSQLPIFSKLQITLVLWLLC